MVRQPLRENLVLASLSSATRKVVEHDLQSMVLKVPQVVRATGRTPGQVVFPRSCIISVVTRTNDGQSVENAVIGYEGVFAVGAEAETVNGIVQLTGAAMLMPREAFDKHLENTEFRTAVNEFNQRLLAFTCQSAVCQAFHTAEQRLARWLLSMRDRTDEDELLLTQDFLASMLGVHRPTVTIAARILQAAGMIQYRYGRVTVVDREGLEEAACECYRVIPKPEARR